jgi:predicted dehydrogenase
VSPARFRVALVGYGSAGRGIHTPLLRAAGVPPQVVVTANPERRRQAEADLDGVTVAPDLAAALGCDPSLIVLASPTGVHAEQAKAMPGRRRAGAGG